LKSEVEFGVDIFVTHWFYLVDVDILSSFWTYENMYSNCFIWVNWIRRFITA